VLGLRTGIIDRTLLQFGGQTMSDRKIVNRNVVLLPPLAVAEKALQLSQWVADRYEVVLLLNKADRLAHVTIHQFPIPEDRLEELDGSLSRFARSMPAINVRQDGYSIFGETGIFWDLKEQAGLDYLRGLHTTLVGLVNQLREWHIMDQHLHFLGSDSAITIEQRSSLVLHANPLALDCFRPHTTVSACKTADIALEVVRELPREAIDWQATSMHLTEVGPSGTCPSEGILKEYEFEG